MTFLTEEEPQQYYQHESDAANQINEALWLCAPGDSATTAGGACKWMHSTVATYVLSIILILAAAVCVVIDSVTRTVFVHL